MPLHHPLPVPIITAEQITSAMAKTKHGHEFRWSDGTWCLMGHVSAHGAHGYRPSWADWWNTETGRVWLKAEGHG